MEVAELAVMEGGSGFETDWPDWLSGVPAGLFDAAGPPAASWFPADWLLVLLVDWLPVLLVEANWLPVALVEADWLLVLVEEEEKETEAEEDAGAADGGIATEPDGELNPPKS